MGFGDVVAAVEDREKSLTVFNPPPETDVVDEVAEYLADYNVAVRAERTESGRPAEFVVLDVDDVVLTAFDLARLQEAIEAVPVADGPGVEPGPFDDVLEHLAEATFTSYSHDRMLAASREIEDRALRVGTGRLVAGFQTADTLRGELERYAELARTGLEVTCFAAPADDASEAASTDDRASESPADDRSVATSGDDRSAASPADEVGGDGERGAPAVDLPELDDGTVVLRDDAEVREYWFVAFDGGDAEHQQCALLAEERSPGSFYGFWSYDPDVVERVLRAVPGAEDPARQ